MAQYLEVTDVYIPPAAPGISAEVAIQIKNIHSALVRALLTGGVSLNGAATQTFQTGHADIPAGDSVTFSVELTTPSHDSTLFITPWWLGSDGQYHDDETVLKPWAVTSISITGVTAPASAQYGATVDIEVTVQNNSESARTVKATYNYDGRTLDMSPSEASVAAAGSKTFTASFEMPNSDVLLALGAFYIDPNTGDWASGDATSRDITLEEAPPPPEEPDITQFEILDYAVV